LLFITTDGRFSREPKNKEDDHQNKSLAKDIIKKSFHAGCTRETTRDFPVSGNGDCHDTIQYLSFFAFGNLFIRTRRRSSYQSLLDSPGLDSVCLWWPAIILLISNLDISSLRLA